MDGRIHYLNTDLDLRSDEDLTPLVEPFHAAGLYELTVHKEDPGTCFACFEVERTFENDHEPAITIAALLSAIESLQAPLRALWDRCTLREFNIGYDCGAEPWAFNQHVPSELLGRMAAAGISLRITLYPDKSA